MKTAPQKLAADLARYYANKDTVLIKAKQFRKDNHEHRLTIERASRLKHKERTRPAKNARQSARNRVVQGNEFLILVKELNKIYTSPCFACGSNENQSIDHLIPLIRGGTHSVGNIITLCLPCNLSKNKKTLTEWFKVKRMIGVD